MEWSADDWRSAFRIELRVQAVGFASRGWPVFPGTFPMGTSWVGRGGVEERGPVPIRRDWRDRLDTNPDDVASWWSQRHPYSLLLATGPLVEAIEVDASHGHRAASVIRELGFPVPIVATPGRRWYFLTSGGQQLRSELAHMPEIRLHGMGSWVPMPPTTFPQGLVHWRVKPDVCSWRLPDPEFVQGALCASAPAEPDSVADPARHESGKTPGTSLFATTS